MIFVIFREREKRDTSSCLIFIWSFLFIHLYFEGETGMKSCESFSLKRDSQGLLSLFWRMTQSFAGVFLYLSLFKDETVNSSQVQTVVLLLSHKHLKDIISKELIFLKKRVIFVSDKVSLLNKLFEERRKLTLNPVSGKIYANSFSLFISVFDLFPV